MTALIILGILVLLTVVLIQMGKVNDLTSALKGEEQSSYDNNNKQGIYLMVFLVLFLLISGISAYYYKNYMLGYGPLTSASEHGIEVDSMFNTTLIITGIVFVITQILTFFFAYKYRARKGRRAQFISHDNKLELIWTLVPSVVLTLLVMKGLVAWNHIFPSNVDQDKVINIGATGYQFAWDLRLSGADNTLGEKNFRKIDLATNPLGIDWADEASMDDVVLGGSDVLYLPVDTTVRVTISSKDVLHNFYLPHFRVKMDAVPGMPTFFQFRPIKTTVEMREQLSKYPEWNVPSDPEDPESKMRWEDFEYELACAELCGKGHYSMRRLIKVVSKSEYEAWLATQKSTYMKTVRGTDADPRKGQRLLDNEIRARKVELKNDFKTAFDAADFDKQIVALKHVFYNTGSASLDLLSKYELNNLKSILADNPTAKVELRGHTDNQGDDAMNMTLSESRAGNVRQYLIDNGVSADRLVAKGFGETKPLESNDTAEGRKMNRRTELRIISK